ncbi:MAG: thioesterase [Spirochaetes bacterium]|nr:thioesterase [Spirochaetota bacterium]
MHGPTPDLVWTGEFPVRLYETDGSGSLAVGSLCDYLQEAAGNHAGALGVSVSQLMERNLTWVLARLRLRIERLPGAGERLQVRTWPSGVERLFALRDFRVLDAGSVLDAGGGLIASALSAWLVIDTATRRPVRTQSVFDPPNAAIPRALDVGVEKLTERLPTDGQVARETTIVVRLSDLDANEHVNNARIAEWVVEGAGPETLRQSRISSLDIDFLAETRHGDTVISRAADIPGGYSHLLFRPEDDREIARARSQWEPRRSTK